MTRADLRDLALTLVVGLVAVGCSHHSRASAPTNGRWVVSSRGVSVWAPDWLADPTAALAEVDSTPVQRGDAIQREVPAGTVGPPPGWRVVIRDPGPWASGSSPTGLVTGLTWFDSSTIEVAWSTTSAGPRLPALAHEEAHAWVAALTGDVAHAAAAGHVGGTQ